jgi:peptide/nickel transport system permease protein
MRLILPIRDVMLVTYQADWSNVLVRKKNPFLRPTAIVPIAVLIVVFGACALAHWVAPYSPIVGDLSASLKPPSHAHWLGTDQLGRDILSRILYGGLTSLLQALVVVAVTLLIAVPLGLVSGYAGGRFDRMVMAAVEVGMAVPAIILVLVVLSVFQKEYYVALTALAVFMSPPTIRNVRGAVMAFRDDLFVDAAKVNGVPTHVIIGRHILRRVMGPVLVQATLIACMALQMTVALAYLGYGTLPPNPTWGNLVSDSAQILSRAAWPLYITGGVVALVVLCLGLLGDIIRDAAVGAWSNARSVTASNAGTFELPTTTACVLPSQATPVLAVRNLAIAYGETLVVSDVSFDVAPGEAIGLVGESGCGKTTVARALLRRGGNIVGGSMSFNGTDVLALQEKPLREYRGGSVGYISQEPSAALDPTMRVGQLLAEVIRRHDPMPRASVKARVRELLEQVQLPDPDRVARLYPFEMSGGMAQRVSIARALAARPAVLVADEPTTALDVTVQAEILKLLKDLQRETGTALILVTHNWGVVSEICDRTIVMYAGQMVEEGRVEGLVRSPAHPYTKLLLACQPMPTTPQDVDLPAIPGSVSDPSTWTNLGCRFAERCPIATDDCRSTEIPFAGLSSERAARCLRAEDVQRETYLV